MSAPRAKHGITPYFILVSQTNFVMNIEHVTHYDVFFQHIEMDVLTL